MLSFREFPTPEAQFPRIPLSGNPHSPGPLRVCDRGPTSCTHVTEDEYRILCSGIFVVPRHFPIVYL
jgi:hypothetical protein